MRLLEVVVALMVGFLLLACGWGVLARGAQASRVLLDRSERVEVERLTPWVLERELAGAQPGLDWSADPAGLSVRAYRGWGVACAGSAVVPIEEGRLVIGYRGQRLPEPDKDSLELTLANGRKRVVGLEAAAVVDPAELGLSCAAATRPTEVSWSDPAGAAAVGMKPVLVRLFERGLYAVDDAFRYRRGAGGRQPLTAAVLDASASFLVVSGGGPLLQLRGATDGGPARERSFPTSAPR